MNERPAGVVLTGGASRRMGRDKAFVEVAGVPMVVRVADALRGAGCDPVWCQGGDLVGLRELGLAAHPDLEPGAGPVAAIDAALGRAPGGALVAACDLPDLAPTDLQSLLGEQPAALATEGVAHLVAWFPAGTRMPLGVTRYQTMLATLGARLVEVSAIRNVNAPADL